jgi:hypothetical protein
MPSTSLLEYHSSRLSDIMVNVDRIGCTVTWGAKLTVGGRRVGKSTRSWPFRRWPEEWVLEEVIMISCSRDFSTMMCI